MIDLTKIEYTDVRNEPNGQSPKYWLKIKGEDYLFKANYLHPAQTKTNYGEMLYTRLSKKLNFASVDSSVAVGEIDGKRTEGVLVKSFFKAGDVEAISLSDIKMFALKNGVNDAYGNSVKSNIKSAIYFANATHRRFDAKKATLEMYKLAIVDYFLGQGDRHEHNVEFILNIDGTMRLAPTFDNGHCLDFRQTHFVVKRFMTEIDDNTRTEKYMGDNVCMTLESHHDDHFRSKHISDDNFIFDLVKLSSHNKEIKAFISNILDIDIMQELDDIEQVTNTHIGRDYKRFANEIFKNRCDYFLSHTSTKDFKSKTTNTLEMDKAF